MALSPFMTPLEPDISDETAAGGEHLGSSPGKPGSGDGAPLPDNEELRRGFLYCLKVFLWVRAGLFLLGLIGVALLSANEHAGLPGWQLIEGPGWTNLFTAWERWDALWFLQIATQGYSAADNSAAFFPLYPLLIRWVSFLLGGHPFAAALLISNVSYLGAMLVVHELTRNEFGPNFARRTVLYMSIFPTAYFFFAPYTESLFLFLAAGSLLAARRNRWEIAGTCAALAAATRSIGVILAVPLAIQALEAYRAEREQRSVKQLATALFWSAFTVVGTMSYLYYWQRASGDWLTPLNDQHGWLREFSWPWETLKAGTDVAFDFIGSYSGGYHQLDWVFAVFALVALIWVAARVPLMFGVYGAISFLIPLFFVFGGRPFMSLPRFLLPIFPLYWALTRFADRFGAHEAVIAVSAAGLGAMTLLFVNWYWVF